MAERLDNFRAAYHLLATRVHTALLTHANDGGVLRNVRDQVLGLTIAVNNACPVFSLLNWLLNLDVSPSSTITLFHLQSASLLIRASKQC
jgi:hypothetical protein